MQIFKETNTIIKTVEAHLVSETDSNIPIFSYFIRLIWLPTKFLKMGIDEKLKGAFIWSFLFFAFLMIGAWFVSKLSTPNLDISNMIVWVAMIAPIILVTFAMPSIYGHSGVSENSVNFVVEHLQNRGFNRSRDIELLKITIIPFENRSRSRINVLKWLVGLLWAAFTYTISKLFNLSTINPEEIITTMFIISFFFFGLLLAYLCVWGYEAALDKLFRTIEFGCNDFCHIIETRVQEGS